MIDANEVIAELQSLDQPGPDVSDIAWRSMQGHLTQLLGSDGNRHLFYRSLYGMSSSSDCTPVQRRAVRNWLDAQPTSEGEWAVSARAWKSAPLLIAEFQRRERQALIDAGQMDLPL